MVRREVLVDVREVQAEVQELLGEREAVLK